MSNIFSNKKEVKFYKNNIKLFKIFSLKVITFSCVIKNE